MQLLQHTPAFDVDAAAAIAGEHFGVRARAQALPSERDQNFLLTNEAGERFVLKIANALESRSLLEAQNAVLDHLRERVSFCPKVMANVSGETISREADHYLRLVTYLPGRPLAEVKPHTPELLRDLGRKLGQLDQAFEFTQFVIGHVRYLGIRKTAEDQIHLAGTAMPAAEQKPLATVVEAAA